MGREYKQFIKEFIPPILLRLRPRPRWPIYTTFDLALADSHSYEDPGVIDIVTRKTKTYQESPADAAKVIADSYTTQAMFVMTYVHPERPLDVLEVGGACGAMYMTLQQLLPRRIDSWRVVETPAMAAAGARFQNGQLTFFDDLHATVAQAKRRDLLIAQGVLQYTPEPIQTLKDLFSLEFDYVYISRTVVGIGTEYPIITKQTADLSENGPGPAPEEFADRKTSRPLTIMPIRWLQNVPSNYRLLHSFVESEDTRVLIGDREITTRMSGIFCERAVESE